MKARRAPYPYSSNVAAVKEKKANIVVMSALLTTTMPSMKTTIDALKQAGVRVYHLAGWQGN